MDLIIQTSDADGGCQFYFYIDVGYLDTVLEIKDKIEKKIGIPVSQQTLFFKGNILQDDLLVHGSDIVDRSRISLVIASHSPPKLRLLLNMSESGSEPLAVEVEITETIQRLKEKIQEATGTPTARIVINAYGEKLPHDKTIQELGLSENSEVRVDFLPDLLTMPLPPSPKLNIFVQNGEEKVQVEVRPTERVEALREKLREMKLKLPLATGYFFTFKQTLMYEDKSFAWHGVGPGDTINILPG